tara:strand:+ start:649 stop:1095 length:447 start_codon:yes stop_codon:yes gene_type:complete
MKKILLISIFLITSCGYQPIYLNKNPDNFIFKKITTSGDKTLNRKIVNIASISEDSDRMFKNELILKSKIEIEETSRNSKGQVSSFRSIITVNLTIKNNELIVKNKVFVGDFSYNNRDNKFDLVEYQDEVKNNIINKIIEEIIIYINL